MATNDDRGNQLTNLGAMQAMGYVQYLNITNSTAVTLMGNGNTGAGITYLNSQGKYPRVAMITTETNPLRFRDDGTAPTATTGVILATGVLPFLYNGSLETFSMIGNANNANVSVLFYG